jgi:hypothetical protein
MSTPSTSTGSRSFVYISAADCFRPLIPSRYIETKRQAEFGIMRKVDEKPESRIIPAFIRPGTSPVPPVFTQADSRSDVSSPYPPHLYSTSLRIIPISGYTRYTPYTQHIRFQVITRRSGRCTAYPPPARRSRRRGNHQSHHRGKRGRRGCRYHA